jgi:hypothetical protein
VVARTAPSVSWLRGAGFDAALVLDSAGRRTVVLADEAASGPVSAALQSLSEE